MAQHTTMKLPHEHAMPSRHENNTNPDLLSRRNWLRHCSHAAWALPTVWALGGCTNNAPTAPSSAAAAPLPPVQPAVSAATPWATGGTAQISAAVRASNPFLSATASSCQLTCEATIGPCHTLSPERSDISDGWDGLPMAMQLRIVDTACQPVAGAIVEVWHTNYTGGYSGEIEPMCNNNAADLTRQFFRGWQRTGADGIVRFDSCYPGWYRGRAVHVHLRVIKGDYVPEDEATTWLTTQLLFSDELNHSIFASAALYHTKGQPDTRLSTDGVIGQEPDQSAYLFDVSNIEGVMLASKTLVIRNSLDDALCRVRGAHPPGGPGGPGGPRGFGGPGHPPPGQGGPPPGPRQMP